MREKLDGFLYAEFVRKRGRLQDRADLFLEFLAGFFRVQAADARDSAVGNAHPFENFDGARLPRAVWPQQAEDFTFLDREAHAPQSLHGAVVLIEVINRMIGSA